MCWLSLALLLLLVWDRRWLDRISNFGEERNLAARPHLISDKSHR